MRHGQLFTIADYDTATPTFTNLGLLKYAGGASIGPNIEAMTLDIDVTRPELMDEMVDRIFPVMQARGGYIPTCDHGVPEEVPYENYLHYRKRALEFA